MQKLVRELYMQLDNGNPKNALKLVTAGLQKFPGHPFLLAFQCVILDRCNRSAEARALAAANLEICTEEDGIRMCVLTLERAGEFSVILEGLSKQYDLFPEYCGERIFAISMISGDAAKAQRVAMDFFRKFKDEKFLLWLALAAAQSEKSFPLAIATLAKVKAVGRVGQYQKLLGLEISGNSKSELLPPGDCERLNFQVLSVDEISEKIEKEGDRIYTFQNVRKSISSLSAEERADLEISLGKMTCSKTPQVLATLARISSAFGFRQSPGELLNLGLEICSSENAEEDLTPGKQLLLVSAVEFLREFSATGNFQDFVTAIAILRFGEKKFPYSSHFKLFQILPLAKIGAISLALNSFKNLGIQNAQWRTLPWLILGAASRFHSPQAVEISREISRFMGNLRHDCVEQIILLANEGCMHRIPEFAKTANAVSRSATLAAANLEISSFDISEGKTMKFADLAATEIDADFAPFNFLSPETVSPSSFLRPGNFWASPEPGNVENRVVPECPDWPLYHFFDLKIFSEKSLRLKQATLKISVDPETVKIEELKNLGASPVTCLMLEISSDDEVAAEKLIEEISRFQPTGSWIEKSEKAGNFLETLEPLISLIPVWLEKLPKKSGTRKILKNLPAALQHVLDLEISSPVISNLPGWEEGSKVAAEISEEISRSVSNTLANMRAKLDRLIKVASSLK